MGFMTKKHEQGSGEQQEETETIRAAVTVAIEPLQREIISLKGEVKELKKAAEKPNAAVLDDGIRKEIHGMMASAAAGIDSYKYAIYSLLVITVILAGAILWNSHRLNEAAENMDWKYDVVTGILSGDRHYWWNGENYEASRKAPEAKRLKEAVERYQKANEQIKKAGN